MYHRVLASVLYPSTREGISPLIRLDDARTDTLVVTK